MHKGILDALPLGVKWNWQMEATAAEGFAQLRSPIQTFLQFASTTTTRHTLLLHY